MMKVVRFSISPFSALADFGFGLGVHRGGRVVQDQDARILQQGAGNRHALFLSAGEGHAFFADQRVVAIRESQDHIMDGGGFRGRSRLLPAERRAQRRR